MRWLILCAFTVSLGLAAESGLSPTEQQKELERLQMELKTQPGQQSENRNGTLKTEDLHGRTIDTLTPRVPTSTEGEAIPPEVKAQLQQQLEKLKKAREENEKFFIEMDKDTK